MNVHYPYHHVVRDCISSESVQDIEDCLSSSTGEKMWYGRENLFRECYQATLDKGQIQLHHGSEDSTLRPYIDKLTRIFLTTLLDDQELPHTGSLHLEVYIDRNRIRKKNQKNRDFFWHHDIISIAGKKDNSVADYTSVLLLSDEKQWKGGHMLLQKGGQYQGEGRVWQQSKNPEVKLHPKLRQMIVFRNNDAGHAVEAVRPKSDAPINRDVCIITCKMAG